ncbi:response regulator [Pseudoxanthomonas sp.]|uniref:LytR/AlgR family response regulator transcription factor n=1 Tax=Pseudoxanthomonas sp. TaxID=1871049 RepID=UPI0028C3BFB0|nr:response regulator [Pseudoxanthomonas sp.]
MSLTALVIDDEPIARHAVVRLLREDPDIEVAGECGDGVSAVAAIRDRSPDLVFLDIQMPAITGLDVVATIGAARMPATIFVTAYEQFAVRAFEANAVDYLVKPFSRERFAETLRRAKQRLLGARGADADTTARIMQALASLQQRNAYLERLPVRENERVVLVDVDDGARVRGERGGLPGQALQPRAFRGNAAPGEAAAARCTRCGRGHDRAHHAGAGVAAAAQRLPGAAARPRERTRGAGRRGRHRLDQGQRQHGATAPGRPRA